MKKLIIFLGLILINLGLFAQVTAITAESINMPKNETYLSFKVAAGDTCGVEQDTVYYEVLSNKTKALSCNAHITGTRTGTDEIFGMTLEGKVWSTGTYVLIDSINTGVVAGEFEFELNEQYTSIVDSTDATLSAHASGIDDNFYRYFRIMITNDGACAIGDLFTPSVVEIKLYER